MKNTVYRFPVPLRIALLADLHDKPFGEIASSLSEHKPDIICVAGDLQWENVGIQAIATNAMKDIPVRMVSYGGSNYNISYLIKEEDKQRALQSLSAHLFK